MGDFTSERIAVKSRTGSCRRFHPRTHFYGGILFGGIFSLRASTSAGKGEHPRLIQRGINVWSLWEGRAPVRPQMVRLWTRTQRIATLPSRPLMGRGEVESWLKHGDDVFSQPPLVSDETVFCVFRGKKTYDDMIELQPSASLGTLRVVVFGRGDRECREWVKPPREPHAIQTVRSCNRYATCLTCSSSLSGSSLPISRSPRLIPSRSPFFCCLSFWAYSCP